jgi:hypothetical protein
VWRTALWVEVWLRMHETDDRLILTADLQSHHDALCYVVGWCMSRLLYAVTGVKDSMRVLL